MENLKEDTELITIKYNLVMRILLMLFALFGVFIGLMFISAINTTLFLQILGTLITIYSIVLFLDILLFQKFEITENEIRKTWVIGKITLPISDAMVFKISYKINRGTINFRSKHNRFLSLILRINLFAVENYKEQYNQIKKILVKIKMLKGDEYGWFN